MSLGAVGQYGGQVVSVALQDALLTGSLYGAISTAYTGVVVVGVLAGSQAGMKTKHIVFFSTAFLAGPALEPVFFLIDQAMRGAAKTHLAVMAGGSIAVPTIGVLTGVLIESCFPGISVVYSASASVLAGSLAGAVGLAQYPPLTEIFE